ncbi:hypothetical protein Q1695_007364 [Nippostrongylus brasiliensis]|nr:hypothetical protein Q1695_007364 [Nippostrongylus brasiliensis]
MNIAYDQIMIKTDFTCGTANTEKDRQDVLSVHNTLRKEVASGTFQYQPAQGTKVYLPAAQNMYEMIYNCDLESQAEQIISGCPQQQATTGSASNLYKGTAANKQYSDATDEWKNTINNNNWGANNKYDSTATYGQFANMINANATAVGCAKSDCPAANPTTVVLCVYNVPALANDQVIYVSGQSCKTDSDCTTLTPAACDTTTGLCKLAPSNTTTPATGMTPSGSALCPNNTGQNDAMRLTALNLANVRRARLANGKVAKNNGRYLPKAADMRQLTYDCNLETQARNYAVQCTTVGSGMWGTSENFRRVSTSVAANRVQAIERATKSWWKQVRRVPGIGRRMVTFKSHHQQSTIRFFTLMAWSSVTSIGCGVKQCGSIFNVVCRYSPAGNVVGSAVYTKGNPCSRCPAGTSCSGGALCA